jgi:prepilin-type N-terminal cleavage/methylation domain-containing protein
MSPFNKRTAQGFSLVEVMVATVILMVGLLGAATLMMRSFRSSVDSKEISIATQLACEKLEDLSRYPSADPHVTVPGASVGSLTADIVQNITVGPQTTPINYYDDIYIAPTTGSFSDIRTGIDPVSGNPNFTTTQMDPDGNVVITTGTAAPANNPNFKRRWIIEQDNPIVGVRRITVLVTSVNTPRPVSFQVSTVRP